ncbi:MAG: PAS domain-containing protein [Flavisolibacter sp.]
MKNRTADIIFSTEDNLSNEEALRLILDNIDDVFILLDRDLKILSINETTKRNVQHNLGVNITEGKSILELLQPDRRGVMIELYKEVLNGAERSTESQIQTSNGIKIYTNTFRPARNARGEIVGLVICSRDITEQKKSEEALQEIEERWRFALEGAKQGVWDWNLETGDVFYSSSYKRLYGYKDDELKGRIDEWESMIHPEDKIKINSAIDEHTSSSDPYYESTYRIRTKEGDYLWILARGMIISWNSEGKPMRMIGTHTDISDQVKAEEKIKTSEQQYRTLFQSNPLPCWIYDAETVQFLEVNKAAIAHYGYSKEEFLKHGLELLHSDEKIDKLKERLKNEKQKRSIAVNSWQHKKKNGEIIFVDLRINSINYRGVEAKLVVAHDVTAKVAAENELKKSNERFKLVSRATSDAIYDWDILRDQLHWGEGMYTLFGYQPKEVTFAMWQSLIHPDDSERTQNSLTTALADKEKNFWKEEYRFRKADGSYSHVLDRGFIIRDESGKAIRIIGSQQDNTDRKYNEQILSLEKSIFELSTNPKMEFKYIVEMLLKGFETIHDDAYTSVVKLRDDNTIESLAAPRLPDAFSNGLKGMKIGPREGSCAASMYNKETVISSDIDNDPLWVHHKNLTEPFGLKACWSLPVIHSSGKVMGSFAIYFKKIKSPTKPELNTLERIRNLLRVLMEHSWTLEEIKLANERFDIMMKATHDLIWDWNLETNVIYRDELGLEQVYGVKDNTTIDNIFKWLSHIHPEDRSRVEKVINEIVQATDQETFDVEYRFLRDDGTYSHVYDRGKIIRNHDGKPIRMIGAVQNMTERKRLEQELLQNELERQKAINQATIDTQEQERSEIGKELHDNVNQVLTTTKLYLDLAMSNPELKDQLIDKSTKNIINVINEIRQLSRSLMDPSIGDLGLIDSIHDLIENINLTRKLHVSLVADRKIESSLNKNQKLTIFRIIQEALNNAIRHAKATTVNIGFKKIKNHIEITIKDDGIGFHASLVKKGAGLKNIENRIYLINGTHSIQTEPDKGCKIVISFPLIK